MGGGGSASGHLWPRVQISLHLEHLCGPPFVIRDLELDAELIRLLDLLVVFLGVFAFSFLFLVGTYFSSSSASILSSDGSLSDPEDPASYGSVKSCSLLTSSFMISCPEKFTWGISLGVGDGSSAFGYRSHLISSARSRSLPIDLKSSNVMCILRYYPKFAPQKVDSIVYTHGILISLNSDTLRVESFDFCTLNRQ